MALASDAKWGMRLLLNKYQHGIHLPEFAQQWFRIHFFKIFTPLLHTYRLYERKFVVMIQRTLGKVALFYGKVYRYTVWKPATSYSWFRTPCRVTTVDARISAKSQIGLEFRVNECGPHSHTLSISRPLQLHSNSALASTSRAWTLLFVARNTFSLNKWRKGFFGKTDDSAIARFTIINRLSKSWNSGKKVVGVSWNQR